MNLKISNKIKRYYKKYKNIVEKKDELADIILNEFLKLNPELRGKKGYIRYNPFSNKITFIKTK